MKEKKQSKSWYISAIHWLTTVLIIFLIWFIPASMIMGKDDSFFTVLLLKIGWFFVLWLGIAFSANNLLKTYVVKNGIYIVRISTVYFGISVFLGILSKYEIGELSISDVVYVVGIFVFYIISKKYIKNDDNILEQK